MRIPVDIVLLPPDDIMDLSIRLSQRAFDRGENKFIRNKTDRLPHMSLLMGCMDETNLSKITEALKAIASSTAPIDLQMTEQYEGGLRMGITEPINQLRAKLFEHVLPHLSQDCPIESLVEDEGYVFDDNSRIWVNDFMELWGGDGFDLHITTHNNAAEDIQFPTSFTANQLALCPMGDHGTCRTPLWKTDL